MDILYHLYYFLSMYFLSWTKTGMDSHAANLSNMVSEISGQELHRNYNQSLSAYRVSVISRPVVAIGSSYSRAHALIQKCTIKNG